MQNKLNNREKFIIYALLIGIGAILVIPFLYMISIAFASPETVKNMKFSMLPKEFNFSNFKGLITNANSAKWLFNSIFLVTFSIIGQVFASSFVAYGFARMKNKRKNIIFMIVLATMMIPGQVTMIPTFILWRKLGLINTLLPIIIPNFFGGAFNIFLLRQFMMKIPLDMDDAAKIDGLGYFGIYFKIILPLIKPALIAIAIFTFNYNWGDFMGALIYVNDVEKMPLSLGMQFITSTGNQGTPMYGIEMATAVFMTIPLIVLFFLGQKHLFEMNISSSEGGK